MATISAPFLNPPAQEDSMELSSPRNRALDEDIEIDFDEDYSAANIQDEQMDDDGDHEDEDMLQFEEDNENNMTAAEPQRFTTIADEDLIDYSDEEDALAPPSNTEPTALTTDILTSVDANSVDKPQVDQTAHDISVTAATSVINTTAQQTGADDAVEISVQPIGEAKLPTNDASHIEPTVLTRNAEDPEDGSATAEERQEVSLAPQETSVEPEEGAEKPRLSTTSFVPLTEGPGTPTDTGLHPVMLYFEDLELPLFRSRATIEGLLKDDNLVSVSLADLIKACRQSIVMKTRRDIDDNLELIFTFDNLSLSVYEDAPAAFQTSLQEVLDVYLQLQTNDGYDKQHIPPLSISCTLHVKFNNSIVVLKGAAERGEGLSALIPHYVEELHDEHGREHDQEQEAYEENGEQEHAEEAVAGQYDEKQDRGEGYEEVEEQEQWTDDNAEEHLVEAIENRSDADADADAEAEAGEHASDGHIEPAQAEVQGVVAAESSLRLEQEVSDENTSQIDHVDHAAAASNGTPTPQNETELAPVNLTVEHDEEGDDETRDTEAQEALHHADGHVETLVEDDDEHTRDSDATPTHLDDITEQGHEVVADDTATYEPAEGELADGVQQDATTAFAANGQTHLEVPDTEHDPAGSDFELDLEDYDRPDSSITTSPATKRQRDVDDTATDHTTVKKLRPS